MVDAMSRRTNYGVNVSTTHRDVTDERYKEVRRPRKVRFFSNGDRYFKGKKLYITPHRYMSFNDMLSDLTGKLPGQVQLPYGVRQIFTPTGGSRIRDLEQLQDGKDYVCAGFEPFKSVQYGKFAMEPWTNDATAQDSLDPHKKAHHHKHNHFPGYSEQFPQGAFRPYYNRGVYGGFNPNRHYRHMYPRGRGPQGQVLPGKNFLSQSEDIQNKPKVVTVVRNGDKPRNIVKILLNKRSVQSYEQLMADISESFGPKWKNNRVRKLYTVRGKEVQSISDFFRNDDLFIAVGTDPLTVNDVADILKEVAPDSTQAKTFRKDIERQKRRTQDVEKLGDLQNGDREDKRDSGFGENESLRDGDDRDDVIHVPQKHDPARTRRKKPKELPPVNDSLTEHEKDVVTHIDTEQKKAVDDDRMRTRKRIQKMEDAEKRAIDEERRKRGLVPQKGTKDDPYRKMLEEREKEREKQREGEKEKERKRREREERKRRSMEEHAEAGEEDEEQIRVREEEERRKKEERKRRLEEKRRREEERKKEEELEAEERRKIEEKRVEEKRKEDESRQKVAEAARKREKEEEERRKREEETLQKIEEEQKIKGANSARPTEKLKKVEDGKKVNEPQKKTEEVKKVDEAKEDEAKDSGVGDEAESTKEPKETKKVASSKSRHVEFDEKEKSSASPKRRGSKQTDSADKRKRRDSVKDKENKVEDDNNNQKVSVQPPVEKKDNATRRRSKASKNKLDRQVSNAERVLDKYEVGKVMGDGNFAVVKACKLKNTTNEYAMKVIDKSKLKGKEHMIENEIAIMKRCTQPNIVKLKEEFETKEEIYLIMELVKGGDLFDAITQSVKFTEKDSAHMVKDLCNALYYLHSRHVVHRDLKPENLLVQRTRDGSMTLKLADFGLAMDVKEPIYTVCGTPTYVAPEILSEIGYGLEVDMWALGVITYILLCGFPPFRSPDRNQTELFEYIKAGEYEFLSPYWDGISRSAKDLIENLLIVDRRRRYKAIDVLTHPWIVTLANTLDSPSNMAEHRLNLRMQLDSQAKADWDAYRLKYHV